MYCKGDKVVFEQEVDRYPHFVVPAGASGTVVHSDSELLSVEVDTHVAGAEEWDNCVHWYDTDDGDGIEVAGDYITVIA